MLEGGVAMSQKILLDTYVLQQDMRIRLPKQILNNLDVKKGKTMFDIFLDLDSNEIILKAKTNKEDNHE